MAESKKKSALTGKVVWAVGLLACGFIIYLFYQGSRSAQAVSIQNKKCGAKPNCVSSYNDPGEPSYIAPLEASVDMYRRAAALLQESGMKIIEAGETLIRAEARSRVFGFVDDVELEFSTEENKIYFRSASRVGHSDLGANRRRIERLKRRLQQSG